MIVYLTRNAIKSGEVENEVYLASAKRINVIPLFAEELKLDDTWKDSIRKYEWITAYNHSTSDAWDTLRSRLLENTNKEREQFWKITTSNEFSDFVNQVMIKYYTEEFAVTIRGTQYPVFCVETANFPHEKCTKGIKAYDAICDHVHSNLTDFKIADHQSYQNNPWYSE